VQKCSLENGFLPRPSSFVLVGYMGGAMFLGLLVGAMGRCH